MANLHSRLPSNVDGRFYVDDTCIYCDYCVETAPAIFRSINGFEWAVVFHQPDTAEELALALEAADGCPTESIGTDGDGLTRVSNDLPNPAKPA